ncbi:DUF4352 domain-containing protein [Plantactinospora sonchi]|uniref:DUF4352 domain-containing protein n=1 Tax=Plantactinospora sonchi TaxID=1544735 RepID=A0ABU7RX89_9ACTN
MTRPDQPGDDPHQPGAGSAGSSGGEEPTTAYPTGPGTEEPTEAGTRPWDWAIDPAPPEGPDQEPMPDPTAGRSVDAPDWSTPETPASTPPLSGYPHPVSWSPHAAEQAHPSTAEPGSGPAAGSAGSGTEAETPSGPVPEFARPADRRWWFILGIVAALLSCCCVAAAVIALAWGPELYSGLRGRDRQLVGLDQPARDGDLEFRVRQIRCGLAEVGDPLIRDLAAGQFCVVGLVIRNLGAGPTVFDDSLQIAYGPTGQRFGVDRRAGLLANADQATFLGELNPGNRVTGAIVYDIPADSRIVRLRLRHSVSSPGVHVRAA